MMPRSDENMKELANDLTNLVLEHKALIQRYEERLDGNRSLDTDDLMRSQIEFLVLNVRAAMVSKEQELRQVQSEVEYRARLEADRESFKPGPEFMPAPAPLSRSPIYPGEPARLLTGKEWAQMVVWPPPPADAAERVVFMHRVNIGTIMPSYQLKDGTFILAVPDAAQAKWQPVFEPWFIDFSEPLHHAD